MENLLAVSVIALWILLLTTLALVIRILRWVAGREEERLGFLRRGSELKPGRPAPEFQARDLAGDTVRVTDYRGSSVAFIFVSPHCSVCRGEVPKLASLAPLAQANGQTEFVLVSDANARETRLWLDALQEGARVRLDLPVLIPLEDSTFLADYNPNNGMPYFCLVDEDGLVRTRSLLVQPEWTRMKRVWERRSKVAPWMNATVHGE